MITTGTSTRVSDGMPRLPVRKPPSPAIELTRMNNAETAAACRMCAHRQTSNNGVRKMPPPVPVRPERSPMPAPTPIAAGVEGGATSGGSPRRKIKCTAEKSRIRPSRVRKTAAGQLPVAAQIRGRNRKQREGPEKSPRQVTRPPKLKAGDRRHKNVQDQGGRSNDGRSNASERHDRDVTGCASVSDR